MSKNIVLVGLMGAGKTTIGKLLSNITKKEFTDSDEIIEKEAGKTINEIFAEHGEKHFRDLEKNTIKKLSEKSNLIISTGGGSIENIENIENLKTNSVLFYLKTTPEILFSRIKTDTTRPLLKNPNPLLTLKNLLERREPFYKMADIEIETTNKTSDEIVKEIIEKYEQF